MDVVTWLRDLGLERYTQAFRDNDIDLELVRVLTEDDLERIGVTSLGARRKILEACAGLRGRTIDVQTASPAGSTRAQAERRQLTVTFVDLVGSTPLASRLDPEDMRTVLADYQDAVAGVINRFEGFVAKFMGDGVLAYFGWPTAHEDDTERAVRAGLEIVSAVANLSTPDGQALICRIGIATGLVVVGDLVGQGSAQEQAVVGETPNLAARLQGIAGPGRVVVSKTTRQLLGEQFQLQALGRRAIKGLDADVEVYLVVAERAMESRFDARGARVLPMVDRNHELDLLLDSWQRVCRGRGQAVLVVGEPGIGKSRVLRALIDRLEKEPITRVRYQCSPYHRDTALWPVIQQLRYAVRFAAEDDVDAQLDKIEALLVQDEENPNGPRLIAELLGLSCEQRYGPLALTPQAKRARTLDALLGQLRVVALARPVLVAYEDAHWMDPSTLDLLGRILDAITAWPVLLLVTSRPDNEPKLAAHPNVTRLTLNRLGRSGAERMVAQLAGQNLPGDMIELIVNRTDGVPLFVEEVTKALVETGKAAIPASLHDSLMARLDRYVDIKEVAQIAACIGREFDLPLLSAVTHDRDIQLLPALERLELAGLVFRRGIGSNALYTFKHALVQDAAYESLLRSRRQELHQRLAQSLATQFSERANSEPELLAYHYTQAELPEQAATFWLKAAERSLARSANSEAMAHLRRGLEQLFLLSGSADRDRRELKFQRLLGTATMAVRGYGAQEALDAFSRALEICRDTNSDTLGEALAATLGMWLFQITRAVHEDARRTAGGLLARALHAGDDAAIMTGHLACAISDVHLGKPTSAQAHCRKGLSIGETLSDPQVAYQYGLHVVGTHYAYDAWSLGALGYHDQALDQARRSVKELERSGHLFTFARGMFWHSVYQQMRGDWAMTERFAARATEAAVEQGFAMVVGVGQIMHGAAVAALGAEDPGLAEMKAGIEIYQSTSARAQLTLFLPLFADALMRQGRAEEAGVALDEAFALLPETNERFWVAEMHRSRAAILLASNRTGRLPGVAPHSDRHRPQPGSPLVRASGIARPGTALG